MKTIKLRTVQFGDNVLDYKLQLVGIAGSPVDAQRGASIDELRKSVRVLEVLEKSNGEVHLEDADYDHLLEKVRSAKYLIINKEVLQFIDDIIAAGSVS
jgi:hypothetical protein